MSKATTGKVKEPNVFVRICEWLIEVYHYIKICGLFSGLAYFVKAKKAHKSIISELEKLDVLLSNIRRELKERDDATLSKTETVERSKK